jgi:O-succinylbenzoate synthase
LFSYQIIPRSFDFCFDARTSRGPMKQKISWFILLSHSAFPERVGIGECGPLPGLSPENPESFPKDLHVFSDFVLSKLSDKAVAWERLSSIWMQDWAGPWLPSAVFGWETAWLDWLNGGKRLICDSFFWSGQWAVPINGLVWMNSFETMLAEARKKIQSGFDTIKIKVGSLEWEEELRLIRTLRSEFPPDKITLRLDANGAWTPEEALLKLQELATFSIHSVEQPIPPGNPLAMARLCSQSPVPIALDEELIGQMYDHLKFSLLEQIQPQYIVLKPTLLGGLGQTHQWIKMAEESGIQWWITSMLESNIGLNAVSQLAALYHPILPQGLGTGALYSNNFESPLELTGAEIRSMPMRSWKLDFPE